MAKYLLVSWCCPKAMVLPDSPRMTALEAVREPMMDLNGGCEVPAMRRPAGVVCGVGR